MKNILFKDVNRLSDLAFEIFRIKSDQNKDDMQKRYADARIRNIAISDTILQTISYAKSREWDSVVVIWNVAGFITLLSLDLKTIMEEIVFGLNNEWKCNYLTRTLCVLLYEACEDIPKIMGKEFYNSISKYNLDSNLLENLYHKKKAIIDFGRKYSNDLRKVRTYVGAHRDHNFLKQRNILDDLDISIFLQLSCDFEKALNELGEIHQKIMTTTTELHVENNGVYDKE